MIRYTKIGDRVYKVYHQYATIGYVGARDDTRWSDWVFVSRADAQLRLRSEIVRDLQDPDIARPLYTSRALATQGLLAALGFAVDPVTPAVRTPRRRTGRGRAFGVEIELTGPSGQRIIRALEQVGIVVTNHIGQYAHSSRNNQWELKYDGSVSGEHLELVSPKLRGIEGMEEVAAVCTALASVDATVDRSCGLHIHHDARGMTAEQIKKQVLAFVKRQTLVDQLVAPSRRSNTYCSPWSRSQIASLENFATDGSRSLRDIAYIGPRGTINLQSYARHGSIEIRYHGGTTNFRKIAAWIRFGQSLFSAAEAGAAISTRTAEEMLRDLIAAEESNLTAADAATLLRFSRVGETRSAVEAAIAEATDLLLEVQ